MPLKGLTVLGGSKYHGCFVSAMKCAVIDLGDETVPVNGTLEETMISSGRSPDAYIFLIGGIPVPEDTVPAEGTVITAVRVASGG
ncbi:MAG: hypothetical protein PHX75_00755 [Candidatus Methanomethylophilaceae archaeon]|nr:hypothetical protein [Candidatus Methanomethylophilaceae archaeon]